MNSMAAAPPIVGGIPVQVPQLPQISMEVAAQAVIPKFYHSVLRFLSHNELGITMVYTRAHDHMCRQTVAEDAFAQIGFTMCRINYAFLSVREAVVHYHVASE